MTFSTLALRKNQKMKPLAELFDYKPAYISQRISFRKHISANVLFPVVSLSRLATRHKMATGRERANMLAQRNTARLFKMTAVCTDALSANPKLADEFGVRY